MKRTGSDVLFAVTLALGVDLAALLGWLRNRRR